MSLQISMRTHTLHSWRCPSTISERQPCTFRFSPQITTGLKRWKENGRCASKKVLFLSALNHSKPSPVLAVLTTTCFKNFERSYSALGCSPLTLVQIAEYLTCLGVTPGMRMSIAKSEESMGMTGLVVPRHSLENDLVGSLNLQKKKKKIISIFLNTIESKLEKGN